MGTRGLVTQLGLPPGFRFHPTDEELFVHYLCRKVSHEPFSLPIIGEIDLYKFDPWVLPGKALFGEKEWYFFSPRDRKYPNGSRPNRVAGSGYWKATGTDKVIAVGRSLGIKKALVFYVGRAPKGSKTNWIMHEYRLCDAAPSASNSTKGQPTAAATMPRPGRLDQWVLCRIYKKSYGVQHQKPSALNSGGQTTNVAAAPSTHVGLHCYQSKLDQLIAKPTMDPYRSQGLQDSAAPVPPLCRVEFPSEVLGGSCVDEEPSFCHQYRPQPPPHGNLSQGSMVVTEPAIRQRHHQQQDDSALFSRLIQSMAGGGLDGSFGLCWQ